MNDHFGELERKNVPCIKRIQSRVLLRNCFKCYLKIINRIEGFQFLN